MIEITLKSRPNQNASISYGNFTYLFKIYTVSGGFTMADISENGKLIAAGVLCVANTPLLDSPASAGNFIFKCASGDYPYFREFNASQKFYFIPKGEDYGGQS